jgi:hypothetical protein
MIRDSFGRSSIFYSFLSIFLHRWNAVDLDQGKTPAGQFKDLDHCVVVGVLQRMPRTVIDKRLQACEGPRSARKSFRACGRHWLFLAALSC